MRNCFGVKLIDFITILLYEDYCWHNNCLQCHIAVKDMFILERIYIIKLNLKQLYVMLLKYIRKVVKYYLKRDECTIFMSETTHVNSSSRF